MPESDQKSAGGVSIELRGVTKRYGSKGRAAVDDVSMHIAAGEIVVFVGPSGCGKTTTLKMINRLIEPTSGEILIDGQDVTHADADELRRNIGYVIQAGGLFPHLSIAANIGIVPGMLGWDKQRTATRVDELLDLVGLEPAAYRDRFPKELSGGQQQRVGVARALAAGPPVLLMDEPFGAVDPITRARLQDELLSIHEELGTTIVMVTHDFDEAVKLGDRIAVLDVGARIVQFDTPQTVLAEPADDFVREFVGSGAGLKQLSLTRVADVPLLDFPTARLGEPAAEVAARVRGAGEESVVLLDERGRAVAWPWLQALERGDCVRDGRIVLPRNAPFATVGRRATLSDTLDTMLQSHHGGAVVTGRRDTYLGVISVDVVMSVLQGGRMPGAAGEVRTA
ncbi:ABC transporter ATP-binding protein [Kineococcus sp. SYSU DK003]|uniref:ABC transporter ATP-binding protein n=1 Tax=Kineococcus sp. SYSU DK003 TaxID=3383124 RepID=UPI003D7D7E79